MIYRLFVNILKVDLYVFDSHFFFNIIYICVIILAEIYISFFEF